MLTDFESPIGWKIVGTKAHMESTKHLPPLLEEPSQNVVFSIVFEREFIFDEIAGVTKKPLHDVNNAQVRYKRKCLFYDCDRKRRASGIKGEA